MPDTIQRSRPARNTSRRVTPSRVNPRTAKPFTLDQELEPFGTWVDAPIWVPPKDANAALAATMLRKSRPFSSKEQRWESVLEEHRSVFTQVREIELAKASIRLPKGKFFVSITERERFDEITDTIPACVKTRLDEFLAGPGKQKGVKVYYLKPLCAEVGDDLIMTTGEDVMAAITEIQDEVIAEYRRLCFDTLPSRAIRGLGNLALAVPRHIANHYMQRRQQAIDAYQARLEFQRRKVALRAAKNHRKYRTDGCTFNQMLRMTGNLGRDDVIEQYAIDQDLSKAQRDQLLQIAAGAIPWFLALSISASVLASVSFSAVPPLVVFDPAFVAEMPDSDGTVLKIGHFDDVGGITHVEL